MQECKNAKCKKNVLGRTGTERVNGLEKERREERGEKREEMKAFMSLISP